MVEKLLTNWLSICLYAFLKVRDTRHLPATTPLANPANGITPYCRK